MRKIFLFLVVMILYIGGCNTSKPEDQNLFPLKDNLICEKINIDLNTLASPAKMLTVDSFLIVLDFNHKHFFNVFSLNSFTHLFSFGAKGRGPGEIGHANCLFKLENGFGIFDIDKQQILIYNMDSLVPNPQTYIPGNKKMPSLKETIYRISPLIDIGFVASGGGGFTEKRYCFIQKDSSYKFSTYPEVAENNYPPEALPLIYQGDIVGHPSLSKFVSVSSKTPLIEFYSFSNGKFDLIKRHQYYYPSVVPQITDSYRAVGSLPDNIYGFRDIEATEDYVYVLYSGRTSEEFNDRCFYGNKILVYDWNGKIIKVLESNIDIATFTINKQNRMFGFSYYPNFAFYELKN